MTFIVILTASRLDKLMPLYLGQLYAAAIPHHVEWVQMSSPSDGTLGRCVEHWKELAKKFSSYDRLILTDAWDVLFYGTTREVEERLAIVGPEVLFAAERNCYPEPFLADHIRHVGTPWRFVNGGCLTAAPYDLLQWCTKVRNHREYAPEMIAQQWLNRRRVDGSPLASIDHNTALFYCMFMEHVGREMAVRDGRPYNTLTQHTVPFVHFNGSYPADDFMKMMEGDKKEKVG